MIRKFLYYTLEGVQDCIDFEGVFFPKQKVFNQENILKMRLIDDGSF